jgi:hypothetical protein
MALELCCQAWDQFGLVELWIEYIVDARVGLSELQGTLNDVEFRMLTQNVNEIVDEHSESLP